jgi:hypothetical protein
VSGPREDPLFHSKQERRDWEEFDPAAESVSGPYVEQTGEPGEAATEASLITEEIEDRFWEAAAPEPLAAGDGIGSGDVRRGLEAVAAALVAAARREGEKDGAAKERERIVGDLEGLARRWDDHDEHTAVVFRDSADAARGAS